MSLTLYNEYNIATHWACPLMYSDYSGLTDEDIVLIKEFVQSLPVNCHFDLSDEEAGFSTDEVSGLKANCVELRVFV